MALSERLQYILDFNTSGAVKSLQQVGSAADKELGKAEAKLDKLGANFTKFGAGAVAFAGVAGAGLIKLASGAAEAEASTAALRQVVDEVSATQIEEWAKGSAVAVGLASKEAIAATTGFAGLGKIIGLSGPELAGFSTSLVQMAADMAAFKDVSPQQALADLQSLFAGSTEVGRKYNIFLDDATLKSAYFRETGERVTGTLTAQQRIIATNSELYRQGADMMGQWGRESGGLAGQQAQLTANLTNLGDAIGKGVLPMLTNVVGAANKGVTAFSNLDPAVQSAVGKFAALGVAGVSLIGTLSLVAGQLIKMRDRFTTLDVATGTRNLNNYGRAARGVAVALGVAAVALTAWSINNQQNQQDIATSTRMLEDLGRAADENLAQQLGGALIIANLGGQSLEETMANLARTNLEAARRTLETGAAAELGADKARALAEAIAEEERARAQAAVTAEEHGEQTQEATEAADAAADATMTLEQRLAGLSDKEWAAARGADAKKKSTDAAKKADEEAAEAVAEHRRRVDELYGSLMQLVGGDIAVREANRAASQAVGEYREMVKQGKASTDEMAAAQDNAASAILRAAQAAAENEIATREAAGEQVSAADKTRIQREALEALAQTLEPGSALRSQIDGYVGDLAEIPADVNTAIHADADADSIARAEAALQELIRDRIAKVQVRLAGGTLTNDGGISFGGGYVARAGGGIVSEPVTLVGEDGPELVSLPAGSRVHTAAQTRAMASMPPSASSGPPLSIDRETVIQALGVLLNEIARRGRP